MDFLILSVKDLCLWLALKENNNENARKLRFITELMSDGSLFAPIRLKVLFID